MTTWDLQLMSEVESSLMGLNHEPTGSALILGSQCHSSIVGHPVGIQRFGELIDSGGNPIHLMSKML